MGMGNELGLVRVLQDQSRLVAIMKDGTFHKAPSLDSTGMRLTA